MTTEDGFYHSVHCETAGSDEAPQYCGNCRANVCEVHIKTEGLPAEPICNGYALTELCIQDGYPYDQENLGALGEEYVDMRLHE